MLLFLGGGIGSWVTKFFFPFFFPFLDVEGILRGNRVLLKNAQSFVSSIKMELLDQPVQYKNFLEGLIKFSTGAWSKDHAIEVLQRSIKTCKEEFRDQLSQILSY